MDIEKIIEAGGDVYRTYFPDFDISMSYRLLTLKEYRVYKSLRDGGLLASEIVTEMVFERCFLGDYTAIPDTIPAGITPSIGGLILWLSGDCDNETLLDDITRMRQEHPNDTVFEYMRATILTAFPSYTIDDIESWSRQKLLKSFVIAENVLGKRDPDREKLDLRKITREGDQKKPAHGIDFAADNRAIRKAIGHPEAAVNQLSRTQLKNLNRNQ